MRRTSTALIALALGACTSSSAVPTTETWIEVTPEQAVQQVDRVDAHNAPLERGPQIGKSGCAAGTRDEPGDVLVIPDAHPREVYCLKVAPLNLTSIELPRGAQMRSVRSGMMQYLTVDNADAADRSVIAVTSKCVPLRKDENGDPVQSSMHEFFEQQSMPYCPRPFADLAVVTTSGPLYFRLTLNETTHTRVVDVRDHPVAQRAVTPPQIPAKTTVAQDLFSKSLADEPLPWTPDRAWADGHQTVVVWDRPMPTLPSLHIGQTGEQSSVPTVISTGTAVAMIYPDRLTEFELRMDTRRLRFSGTTFRRPPQNRRDNRWDR